MVAILDIHWNNFSYFLSTSHPDASYQLRVNWPFCSGEEAKNNLHHGGHFRFPIGKILAIFDLQEGHDGPVTLT